MDIIGDFLSDFFINFMLMVLTMFVTKSNEDPMRIVKISLIYTTILMIMYYMFLYSSGSFDKDKKDNGMSIIKDLDIGKLKEYEKSQYDYENVDSIEKLEEREQQNSSYENFVKGKYKKNEIDASDFN